MKTTLPFNGHSENDRLSSNEAHIPWILSKISKRHLQTNVIVIARFKWLKRNRIKFPANIELPNLYIKVKQGRLIHAYYTDILTHVIKKQNYYIKLLN